MTNPNNNNCMTNPNDNMDISDSWYINNLTNKFLNKIDSYKYISKEDTINIFLTAITIDNHKNNKDNTFLESCYIVLTLSFYHMQDEYIEIINYLSTNYNLDIHTGGDVLLNAACRNNMLSVVKYLLANCNLKQINEFMHTHNSCKLSLQIIKIFMEYKIDLQVLINNYQIRAIDDLDHSNIIKLLMSHGYLITNEYFMIVLTNGHIESLTVILDANLSNIDINFNNCDPIRTALLMGRYDIYNLLISHGATFDVQIFNDDIREQDAKALNALIDSNLNSNEIMRMLLAKISIYEKSFMIHGFEFSRTFRDK